MGKLMTVVIAGLLLAGTAGIVSAAETVVEENALSEPKTAETVSPKTKKTGKEGLKHGLKDGLKKGLEERSERRKGKEITDPFTFGRCAGKAGKQTHLPFAIVR